LKTSSYFVRLFLTNAFRIIRYVIRIALEFHRKKK